MTAYVRERRTITVHCPTCAWLRTVFDDNTKHQSLEHRSKKVLQAHIQKRHPRKKGTVVMINGR